jgi:serine/threonine-protein kinase
MARFGGRRLSSDTGAIAASGSVYVQEYVFLALLALAWSRTKYTCLPPMSEAAQQRYRVVEKLESGGMAEVFRAESEGLQGFKKQVAIKRVLPHLSEKKKFISMFLDEARLSAQLNHSNCVQVFDIGVGDNAYFIVMEYVDGANLKAIAESLRKNGREFPVQQAALIALEICKGLSYAHELRDTNGADLKIVHRDMSPPNVLVTKYGEIKIVDFGLAKANSQLERSEPGIIKGKFSYLSPEAALGQEVDAKTDIFAVGIILWELLSGQRLFLGDTDFQTVKKVQQAVVPPISQINKGVPPELERIVARALARDPNARYQTARELGVDLSKFMFKYGHPVSTFDIATLVNVAMRDRAKMRPQQGSIIDKLIEEALLEFTSLKTDGEDATQSEKRANAPSATPLNPDQFVDPTNWANEIAFGEMGRRPKEHSQLPQDNLSAGNLSALEDAEEPPGLSRPPTPQVMTPVQAAAAAAALRGSPAAPNSAKNLADPPRKTGAVVGTVVAVVTAAVFAVAWFAHWIPHH